MIIYTVICRSRDTSVLVEVSSPELTGNAPQVTATLLGHLHDHPEILAEGERKTFVQRNQDDFDFFSSFIESCASAFGEETVPDDYYFHVYYTQGVYYCCIGDDSDIRDQKVNFALLEQISNEFTKRYRPSRIANANAYALDRDFKPTVRSAVHYHNVNHTSIAQEERVQKLLAKVEDMRKVMGRNINLLLQRGENLNKLVDKSAALEQDAAIFKKRSNIIRRKQQRKYWFMMFIITVIAVVILYVAVMGICGEGLKYCRTTGSSSSDGGGGESGGEDGGEDGGN